MPQRGAVLGIPDSVLDVGAHAVPGLDRYRLGGGGHVQVRGDERVRVHVRDEAV